MIFRYYITPNFPNLSTFAHHQHLPDDINGRIVASKGIARQIRLWEIPAGTRRLLK